MEARGLHSLAALGTFSRILSSLPSMKAHIKKKQDIERVQHQYGHLVLLNSKASKGQNASGPPLYSHAQQHQSMPPSHFYSHPTTPGYVFPSPVFQHLPHIDLHQALSFLHLAT
eukprot:1158758-Pelagomonas_calceolata.AAC.4